ncbi:MAG: YbjN domain-containing protein [Candidatus Spyradocola sp.]|jgi:hypothetical protein
MENWDALRLCAAYAEETGLAAVLSRKGENDAPFDMLFLPAFLQAPDEKASPMSFSVYFANSPYAFMERLEYDLLHMMGYIEHVTRPSTVRELRAFLGEVNFQMPVGAFDVDADGTVFLRYTLPVPKEMTEETFLRQYGIVFGLLNAFALAFLNPIFAVIRGERTAKTAMDLAREELDRIQARLRQSLEEKKGDNPNE